jgi:hypothetical protein
MTTAQPSWEGRAGERPALHNGELQKFDLSEDRKISKILMNSGERVRK